MAAPDEHHAPALDGAALTEQWRRDGYVIVRNLLSPERAAHLAELCDGIAAQWRSCSPETDAPGAPNAADATCMRHLNHPAYFERDTTGGRVAILETVADPGVLDLCTTILGDRPAFRSTSLFMNPTETSTNGEWHRDDPLRNVPVGPIPTPEEQGMIEENVGGGGESGGCIQLQIALIPSDDVELVKGSHLRWDTPEEWHVRMADGKAYAKDGIMPRAERIALQPGDGVAFNPFGLHRGRYHADKQRRTLMLSYRARSLPLYDYFSDQPWCESPGYLDGLTPAAAQFWREFVDDYSEQWREGQAAALMEVRARLGGRPKL